MTRQEAKRRVCGYVLSILSASATEEVIHDFYDYSEADQQRLEAAISDLQAELGRRSSQVRA